MSDQVVSRSRAVNPEVIRDILNRLTSLEQRAERQNLLITEQYASLLFWPGRPDSAVSTLIEPLYKLVELQIPV